MSDRHDVLDRFAPLFPAPEPSFEGFLRRRDRKLRNQRIAAGVVALLIAIAFAAGGAVLLRSRPRPAGDSSLPPILHQGEVPVLVERNGIYSPLQALDPSTGERRTLVSCQEPCVYFSRYAVSADRRWLAYEMETCGPGGLGCGPEAGLWVSNTLGQRRHLTHACDPPATCHEDVWAWSPRGATLAGYLSGDAALVTIDPLSGARTTIARPSADVTTLAWSSDGSRLAYATDSLDVVDLGTGASTVLVDRVGEVDTIDWSPDGTSLVFDGGNRISEVNADGSDLRVLVDQPRRRQGPETPAWSPDGARIAFASTGAKEIAGVGPALSFEVWVIEADGSGTTRLFAGEFGALEWRGPVWSPDGTRIAFWDDADTNVDYESWIVVNGDGTATPDRVSEAEVLGWQPEATIRA